MYINTLVNITTYLFIISSTFLIIYYLKLWWKKVNNNKNDLLSQENHNTKQIVIKNPWGIDLVFQVFIWSSLIVAWDLLAKYPILGAYLPHTLIAGIIISIYLMTYYKYSLKNADQDEAWVIEEKLEWAKWWLFIIIIYFIIRSFIIQPYRVPTGSLEPTILPGDLLMVNQFSYGIRFPIGYKQLLKIGLPKRGDIALFHYPAEPRIMYVKRIIGIPGDNIIYKNKMLYINGKLMPQMVMRTEVDAFDLDRHLVTRKLEWLDHRRHEIYVNPSQSAIDFSLTVPQNHYFAMGDNRDDSYDSRYFGFIPEKYLVGKAMFIWMHWNKEVKPFIKWNRIGKIIE